MIGGTMVHAALLGSWLAGPGALLAVQTAPPATPGAGAGTSTRREAFLKRVEAAFAAREPECLAALADVDAWRAAGYPELSTLQLFLPPAPLVFEKELAPLEVLFRDGNGRSWRLVLREMKGELLALVRAEPCPRGAARAPRYEREARPTPRVQAWTLLECWPLPK